MMQNPVSKTDLRATLRQARREYVLALRAQGLETQVATAESLAAQVLPHLAGARVVAGYRPTPWEIDPSAIEAQLLATGVTVALPRVHPSGIMTFHAVSNDSPTVPGAYGIHEPSPDAPVVVPEVLLVPLVAVDLRGFRLGQGGGHYDRTLESLRARAPVRAIGLAFDIQVVEQLPAESHDQNLDAVATPTRWISFTTPMDSPPVR